MDAREYIENQINQIRTQGRHGNYQAVLDIVRITKADWPGMSDDKELNNRVNYLLNKAEEMAKAEIK